MKHQKNTPVSSSPTSQRATDVADKNTAQKQMQAEPADDTIRKVDRPGFDLGGSSGDTQAGTGLGLGEDASDTPGDRRLPGRRHDNKLTIPRWGGPEPLGTTESAEERTTRESQSAAPTVKRR